DPVSSDYLDIAEAYADGRVSDRILAQARFDSRNSARHEDEAQNAVTNATSASAWGAAVATAEFAARAAGWASATLPVGEFPNHSKLWRIAQTNVDVVIRGETSAQSDLVREIFGNPFRALPLRPEPIAG